MNKPVGASTVAPDRRCEACGGDSQPALVARDFNRRIDRRRFHYRRCNVCGLLFLEDAPADLSPYYPASYYPLLGSVADLREAARFERYKLDVVQRTHRSGRLLEIGPGAGAFALLASDAGFDVHVAEMPGPSTEWIRANLPVSVHESDEPVALVPSLGTFDVVTLWHSWEHLPRPWHALDLVADALEAGGTLVIATPNPTALQLRILRARWTHLDAPRHVILSPASVVVLAAARRGLIFEHLETADQPSRGWNRFGWEQSLAHLSTYPPATSLLSLTGRIIARCLRQVETSSRWASTYTLVMRKAPS